jgi:hypothetical protein
VEESAASASVAKEAARLGQALSVFKFDDELS